MFSFLERRGREGQRERERERERKRRKEEGGRVGGMGMKKRGDYDRSERKMVSTSKHVVSNPASTLGPKTNFTVVVLTLLFT